MRVSKEIPLAEITLRKYEKPQQNADKRELTKKFLLSLGLLSPGDSRDSIIDIFHLILECQKGISAADLEGQLRLRRKELNIPMHGVAASNIRRQLQRLKDIFLIEKVDGNYRIAEGDTLERIFEERIHKYYLTSILSRVREYAQAMKGLP